jgi:hypothetical protein
MSLADIRLIAALNRGRVQMQLRQQMVELTVDEARQLMADLHAIAKSVAWAGQEPVGRKNASPARDPLSRAHLQRRLLAVLEQTADMGAYCPTNREIAERLGTDQLSVGGLIEALESRRFIRVERTTNSRVVTILATGKATADPQWKTRRRAGQKRNAAA